MDQEPVAAQSFNYTGVIDVKGFLDVLKQNITTNGFTVKETKFEQTSDTDKKGYNIEWTAVKVLDDYMEYSMSIKITFENVKDTTVMKGNAPTVVKTGTVKVDLKASVDLDYMEKWSVGLLKILRPLFDRMNKEVLEERKRNLETIVNNIITSLKNVYS